MIWFYSGTPGSGKSLSCAKDIKTKLRKGERVITNMMVNYYKAAGKDLKKAGSLYYVRNNKLTPQFLMNFARKFHVEGKEGQTLIIIDEAQMLLSPTVMKLQSQRDPFYRVDWLDFLTQHRHMGYNIIVVSQFDRLIDPQVRCLFEYDVKHRKINNVGWFGMFLTALRIKLFVRIETWYGMKMKISSEWFVYTKKYSEIYNSYSRFKLSPQ